MLKIKKIIKRVSEIFIPINMVSIFVMANLADYYYDKRFVIVMIINAIWLYFTLVI